VASECGYTPQYEDLQNIYEQANGELIVLGFPANNFGGQEPGTNEEIKQFCTSRFSVDFPMYAKISVKGDDQHPLYKWLSTKSMNGWNDQSPEWNFCKYLIDEEGRLVKYYPSRVVPTEILNQINQEEIE
ncbi:MAG: glutathione peroxidase, partial [Bacteroidota bacterium]